MLSSKEIIVPNNLLNVAHKKKGVKAGIVNAGKPLPMLSVLDAVNENLIEPVFIGNKNAQEESKGDYIFHSGSNIGYLSLSIISKDGKKGAVILINKGPNPFTTTEIPEYSFITDSLKLISNYNRWD